MGKYVPLHVHTEYSLLDGAIRNKDYCKFAKENGFEAIAITDHGNMYGAMELYRTCKDNGIKPIIGCEVYVYDGDIKEKQQGRNKLNHLVLIAKNKEGYQNLVKIVSASYIDGFYYKPRVNHELIEKHKDGLICLSACIQGELAQEVLKGTKESAREIAKYYLGLFGEDFYIEIQDHGLTEQKQSNPELIAIAKELNVKLVITNDSHYLKKEDALWHDTLLCIQTNALKSDEHRFKFPNNEFYVKTEEQLRDAFKWLDAETFNQAIENTSEVAEKCHLIIKMGENILPHYDVPKNHTIESYLDFLVREGLEQRYGTITPEIEERRKYELDIISKMGFSAYFLIVWDFINYSREHGIPVGPGRGSAAGSLIAYSLGITDLDPMRHHLLFERFLNPERVSMPDVDIDFCIVGRGRVIEYVTEKYGADKVCQIITFGSLGAKNAIKAVARVLDIPFAESNQISQLIPNGPKVHIDDALAEGSELKDLYDKDERIRNWIDEAKSIEGLKQNIGMHAAGVIIARDPLDTIVPVQYTKEGNVITQYPKEDCEKIGLLKMDFLGLKNLTTIQSTLDMIKERRGIDVEINKIPLDDKKTFSLLNAGDTDGVFQLESAGMKSLVKRLKPSVFEDLGALVALFRPGPLDSGMVDDFVDRKHGRQKVTYPHPSLEPILKDTYGTIVYQEQIMQIAQVLAGYSLGQADMLRRAMGKKKVEIMQENKAGFVDGAKKNNVDEKIASDLFDTMAKFAAYCFNRSHSAAYAFVAYQTAYLKAHYPIEYFCALLSSVKDDQDKTQMYIAMAQKMGIKVLPPDINKSHAEFAPDENNIRFGLNSVKGIGGAVLEMLEEERKANGEFKSIADFAARVNTKCLNKKTLESLIKAGAFTCLEPSRKKMFNNIDNIITAATRESQARELGQVSLFAALGGGGEATATASYQMQSFELYGDDEDFSDSEIQAFEKEYLGFYVTSHPLESIRDKLPFLTTHNICDLVEMPNDKYITICGLLTQVRQIPLKKDPTKFLKAGIIEDLTGKLEFVAFHKTLQAYNSLMQAESKVILSGKFQRKDEDRTQIIVESVKPVDNSNIITLNILDEMKFEEIVQLKDLLCKFKGTDPIMFKINGTKILGSTTFWIEASNDMTQTVEKAFDGKIKVEIKSLDS
ncbi:MAG: DNA polymerase III subunit alpha [Candidatus Gastranaerophilales bacterium]|nr:DNA polymerase III subunit alpha [Candidatus Gastranaerophilales bacterium]